MWDRNYLVCKRYKLSIFFLIGKPPFILIISLRTIKECPFRPHAWVISDNVCHPLQFSSNASSINFCNPNAIMELSCNCRRWLFMLYSNTFQKIGSDLIMSSTSVLMRSKMTCSCHIPILPLSEIRLAHVHAARHVCSSLVSLNNSTFTNSRMYMNKNKFSKTLSV